MAHTRAAGSQKRRGRCRRSRCPIRRRFGRRCRRVAAHQRQSTGPVTHEFEADLSQKHAWCCACQQYLWRLNKTSFVCRKHAERCHAMPLTSRRCKQAVHGACAEHCNVVCQAVVLKTGPLRIVRPARML